MAIDPQKHAVGRIRRFVCSGAMESNAWELKRFYPNDEERGEFANAVKQDMENPAYHWYSLMYVILLIPINILDMLS